MKWPLYRRLKPGFRGNAVDVFPKQGLFIDRGLFLGCPNLPRAPGVDDGQRPPTPNKFEGVIDVSRGYDGPEIDDFRDSSWGRERDRSSRDLSRGRGHDWQTQASTRLKLQQLREAKSRSDKPIAQSCERPDRSRPTSSPEDRQLAILKERDHLEYTDRDRSYSLRPSEIHTLTEVGKFRVVSVEDLAKLLTHATGREWRAIFGALSVRDLYSNEVPAS